MTTYINRTPADDGISAARADAARIPETGTKFWIVTRATKNSELIDICFQATAREFALQVRGGLDPDDVLGWFETYSEANQNALQELHRAGVNTGRPMLDPRQHRPLTPAIRPSAVRFSTRGYENNHGAKPRGDGQWGFVAAEYSQRISYLDHVQWFSGTYAAAKKQAARSFAADGITDVVVCS